MGQQWEGRLSSTFSPRIKKRHYHRYGEWRKAGIFDSTMVRRCKCGRIQTRKPTDPRVRGTVVGIS